jgi:hypothetical protein
VVCDRKQDINRNASSRRALDDDSCSRRLDKLLVQLRLGHVIVATKFADLDNGARTGNRKSAWKEVSTKRTDKASGFGFSE